MLESKLIAISNREIKDQIKSALEMTRPDATIGICEDTHLFCKCFKCNAKLTFPHKTNGAAKGSVLADRPSFLRYLLQNQACRQCRLMKSRLHQEK